MRAGLRAALAVVLTAVLANRDLRQIAAPPGPRGLGDRMAVTVAAIRGRLPSALGEQQAPG